MELEPVDSAAAVVPGLAVGQFRHVQDGGEVKPRRLPVADRLGGVEHGGGPLLVEEGAGLLVGLLQLVIGGLALHDRLDVFIA